MSLVARGVILQLALVMLSLPSTTPISYSVYYSGCMRDGITARLRKGSMWSGRIKRQSEDFVWST